MTTFNIDIEDADKLKHVLDMIKQSGITDATINITDTRNVGAVQAPPEAVVNAVRLFFNDKNECTRNELIQTICSLGIKEATAAVYISLMLRRNVLSKEHKLYSLSAGG